MASMFFFLMGKMLLKPLSSQLFSNFVEEMNLPRHWNNHEFTSNTHGTMGKRYGTDENRENWSMERIQCSVCQRLVASTTLIQGKGIYYFVRLLWTEVYGPSSFGELQTVISKNCPVVMPVLQKGSCRINTIFHFPWKRLYLSSRFSISEIC